MREILFRGKTNDGQWLEGDLIQYAGTSQIWVQTDEGKWNFVVDPATVGQFTGLCDKNGKKIFEGDILLTNGMDGKLLWVSYFDDETAQFDFCPLGHEYCSTHNELYYSSKRQIIGNIHDNPELLEAKS